MLVTNDENPGKIHIAMAGIKGIESEGEILYFHFKSIAPLNENINQKIEITRELINDWELDCPVDRENNANPPQVSVEPERFVLAGNFPNPFNAETKIIYSTPKPAFTRVSIFNSYGQEIEELVNEYHQPGVYQIGWNSRGLCSGVYFCRLHAGEFSRTIKMILIR